MQPGLNSADESGLTGILFWQSSAGLDQFSMSVRHRLAARNGITGASSSPEHAIYLLYTLRLDIGRDIYQQTLHNFVYHTAIFLLWEFSRESN